MKIITEAHREFLLDLLKEKVSFLVIGGYSVIYHGYPRLTMDLDILLKPDNENKKKLLPALRSYGIVKKDIEQVGRFDFTRPQSFHIGEKNNKIDFLTSIAGFSYKEADDKKEFFELEGNKIPVMCYEHLIVNKMLTGRLQDKADVDMLQKIQSHRNEK